jgi:hypothetical protein
LLCPQPDARAGARGGADADGPLGDRAMFKFLFFIVHVVLFLIAAVEIMASDRELFKKVLWLLFIFFFPVLGLIIYYLFGRRPRARLA